MNRYHTVVNRSECINVVKNAICDDIHDAMKKGMVKCLVLRPLNKDLHHVTSDIVIKEIMHPTTDTPISTLEYLKELVSEFFGIDTFSNKSKVNFITVNYNGKLVYS